MRSEVGCIPCVLRQCERVVKAAAKNEQSLGAGQRALSVLKNLSLHEPPSTFTSRVLLEVYEYLGTRDPFRTEKQRQARLGRSFAHKVNEAIKKSKDPIKTALHYAAAANIIDVGTQESFDLETVLAKAEAERFAIDDYRIFKKQLKSARTILYILDNAGEIYFDLLFLELLKNYNLTVAAKPSPILNDVTMTETKEVGLDRWANVIDTGSGFLGINFATMSAAFKTAYENSDIIIAKGHANFESLIDQTRPAFFLLKAKCPVVANKLGVRIGDSVFYYYNDLTTDGPR